MFEHTSESELRRSRDPPLNFSKFLQDLQNELMFVEEIVSDLEEASGLDENTVKRIFGAGFLTGLGLFAGVMVAPFTLGVCLVGTATVGGTAFGISKYFKGQKKEKTTRLLPQLKITLLSLKDKLQRCKKARDDEKLIRLETLVDVLMDDVTKSMARIGTNAVDSMGTELLKITNEYRKLVEEIRKMRA